MATSMATANVALDDEGEPVDAREKNSWTALIDDIDKDELVEVLVTHYPPGAGIGWHRDAPMFGVVVGVSLARACRFRFQRGNGAERVTAAAALDPRSAYVLDGPARWQWQHSIPPAKTERYSVTYRTLRRSPRSEP